MNSIKFNTRIFSLIVLISASMSFVISCSKNDNGSASSQTVLLSFGPTGAKPGDTLRFIGTNLNIVSGIELTGASVPKISFVKQTNELILIIMPKETVKGFVTLKTPQGDIKSKTALDLMVPVMITSIPKEARPGDNITITGNYLNWVNYVTFAKDKSVDSSGIVSRSLDKLVVKVPANAQTGKITLTYGGTMPGYLDSDSILIVTLPSITGIAPNPAKVADNLTITGLNLDLAWGVLFTGVTQADTVMVSKSATMIVVKVPAGAKKGKVTILAPSKVMVQSPVDLVF
ncbi:MAG: IPT/TIG domain-containing protein [Chitinophagaceae bacterium]